MSYQKKAISSDDPNALEKLTAKLENCEKRQAFMKETNAYYRKHGTCKGCPNVSDDMAIKLDSIVENAYSWNKQPFPSYELTNNNAEIRRLKQRIKQIEVNKEVGFVGWDFNGGKVVANSDINRLQVIFDEKPDGEKCSVMKHQGFHWSPSEGAWQRQLNDNSIYAASRVGFICPSNGGHPIKMQPKVQQKDVKER